MTSLLVTALAWVSTVACLLLVACLLVVAGRPPVSNKAGRRWILLAGTGLVVVAGGNAVVAALMLRPWISTQASVAHGEVWFLVAGSLDLAVAAFGAALVRRAVGRRSATSGNRPAQRSGLFDRVGPLDEKELRKQDSLLQGMVAAKLAIELDQPQRALDVLGPAISHLSVSVTQAVVGKVP